MFQFEVANKIIKAAFYDWHNNFIYLSIDIGDHRIVQFILRMIAIQDS